MAKKDAEKKARNLRSEIRHHDYLYYVKNAPEISDEKYDELLAELRKLEDTYPELQSPDSPTQKVGAKPLDEFPTVRHTVRMLSLDSDKSVAAVKRFDQRVRKALGKKKVRYVLEPKHDGASVELVYEDGVLARGVTRGDGTEGEGVTENIRTISWAPLELKKKDAPAMVAVRAEVMMAVEHFEKLNERLMAEGKQPFANPRNAAAGSLRQHDPQVTARRPLDAFAYDIIASEGFEVETQWDVLQLLADWGFHVSEFHQCVNSIDEIVEFHEKLHGKRDDLEYEIDGVVIKVDDFGAREKLGSTSHHPRWAFAFKFPPRKEVTQILKIVPSVGRTGVVTPVAIMRPVEIGGVTVSRASLHNREEVERKDVREKDTVRIHRAGDVIPEVVERVKKRGHKRGPEFRMPRKCPSCGTALEESGPYTVCPNQFGCPAQVVGRIIHFASRRALDIDGLGEKVARKLYDEGLVKQLPDLFDLSVDQVKELEGFQRKSAENLVNGIQKGSNVELERFLYGLGIPEVGASAARDLARHFGSIDALRKANRDELEAVRDVGPEMAKRIHRFFQQKENKKVLDSLLDGRVTLKEPKGSTSKKLDGLTFVFTGRLESLSRQDAEDLVESQGAQATSSVSDNTDYVVVGEDPGSKYDDAERAGVETMDEKGFLKFLKSRGVKVA